MKCYPLRSRCCQCSAHNPSYPLPCSRILSPNEVRLEQPAPEAPCQWAVLRLLEVFVFVFVLAKYIELLKWPGISVPPPIKPLTNASRCWNINTQTLLLQSGQLEGMISKDENSIFQPCPGFNHIKPHPHTPLHTRSSPGCPTMHIWLQHTKQPCQDLQVHVDVLNDEQVLILTLAHTLSLKGKKRMHA